MQFEKNAFSDIFSQKWFLFGLKQVLIPKIHLLEISFSKRQGSKGRAIDCMSERLLVRIPLGTFFFFFAFKITQNYILLEAEGLENELCVSEVRTAPRFFKVRFTN